MIKQNRRFQSKLRQYAFEFRDDRIVLAYIPKDKKSISLYCEYCSREVNAKQKWYVHQHISTGLHKRNRKLHDGIRRQQFRAEVAFPSVDKFTKDLCEEIMATDIPFEKIEDPAVLINFLFEEYTRKELPFPELLTNYVKELYESTLDSIRCSIGNKCIWVSIKETEGTNGRAIIQNIVVGTMDGKRSECFLLDCVEIPHCSSEGITKLFNDAMTILWPNGVNYERVLFFVADRVSYIEEAGRVLQKLFPRMIHLNCLASDFHDLVGTISYTYDVDELMSGVRKVFLEAPERVNEFKAMYPNVPLPPKSVFVRGGTWLRAAVYYADHFSEIKNVVDQFDRKEATSIRKAQQFLSDGKHKRTVAYVKHNFGFLSDMIEGLENRNTSLREALEKIETTAERLKKCEDVSISKAFVELLKVRNHGFKWIKQIGDIHENKASEDETVMEKYSYSSADLKMFNFTPLTSCDVKSSFVMYEDIFYHDNRRIIPFEELKMLAIIYCNDHKF